MKLPDAVLGAIRGVGGVALVVALSSGCGSGATMSQKPTLNTQAPVVASANRNRNQPAALVAAAPAEPEPEMEAAPQPVGLGDEWTQEDMMMGCGRG